MVEPLMNITNRLNNIRIPDTDKLNLRNILLYRTLVVLKCNKHKISFKNKKKKIMYSLIIILFNL